MISLRNELVPWALSHTNRRLLFYSYLWCSNFDYNTVKQNNIFNPKTSHSDLMRAFMSSQWRAVYADNGWLALQSQCSRPLAHSCSCAPPQRPVLHVCMDARTARTLQPIECTTILHGSSSSRMDSQRCWTTRSAPSYWWKLMIYSNDIIQNLDIWLSSSLVDSSNPKWPQYACNQRRP